MLPKGVRRLLQLKALDNQWHDWLYVKKSDIPNAGNGIFAARDFEKNSIIGYYCGKTVYKSNEMSVNSPDDISDVPDFSEQQLWIRNNKYYWILIEPTPMDFYSENNLYMGFHFLNSNCLNNSVSRLAQNVEISQAGMVTAIALIRKDTELIWSYC